MNYDELNPGDMLVGIKGSTMLVISKYYDHKLRMPLRHSRRTSVTMDDCIKLKFLRNCGRIIDLEMFWKVRIVRPEFELISHIITHDHRMLINDSSDDRIDTNSRQPRDAVRTRLI